VIFLSHIISLCWNPHYNQSAPFMPSVYCREITRRTPFKIENVPWIAQVYSAPFNRWSSLGRQALFGAPNFLAFYLFQKFWPFKTEGSFFFQTAEGDKRIAFNAKNTQFVALYGKEFSAGYEPHISALMEVLLPNDGVFYDIGSNWGWFTLFLASKPGFQGKIHAFEPFAASYFDLCNVVSQAGLSARVTAHHLALSNQEGLATMALPDKFQSGQATLQESVIGGKTVRTATLDSLKLDPPDLVKVDVEGAEFKVFSGGLNVFSQNKPMIVFESSRNLENPWCTLEPLALLHSAGYKFFHVGWLREARNQCYVTSDDSDSCPLDREKLMLSPFAWNERLLRPNGMNILACHKDRIDHLKSFFQEKNI